MGRLSYLGERKSLAAEQRERERIRKSWAAAEARVDRQWRGLPPEPEPSPAAEPKTNGREKINDAPQAEDWPEPKPLPNGLPKVDAFADEFLPNRLAPWVTDTSDRLQCPPDYVAVAALTALGAVIGRRVGIKPQAKHAWTA